MAIFGIGPDGLLLLEAVVVSILVAAFAWRRVPLPAAAIATTVVAMTGAIWLAQLPDASHPVVAGLLVMVPSALLLGASRVRWLADHAWVLVLLGPIGFIGCYAGICEFCVRTRLISLLLDL